ncbi:MAG: shikimate dehydrogenase [Thermoleophilia bacterium]|nr:shikimate dehydrogenase [Thermoleophilia bacterium]
MDVREQLTSCTRLVAILGHPVRHSRSPALHNAAFAAQGLDMVYLAFDVPGEQLTAAVAGLKALGVVGANITVPHKETVVPLLDTLDSTAQKVGAVNTVVYRDGALVGYNTDVYGFLMALQRGWGRGPRDATCLVLGAGGAARAVVAGLLAENAAQVLVYNRTLARARDLCTAAAAWGTTPCRVVTDNDLPALADRVDLIVNCTAIGLEEGVKVSPVPVDILRGHHMVLDLVYGREPTTLLQAARQRGCTVMDGLEMLVQQAARAFEIWTDRAAPIELMRETVMSV